jgi:ATP-dependent RNA helicase DDX42
MLTKKLGFTEPTPIQRQTIPAAMAGRDLIGIAKTGSGKTAAYVIPMLVHILDQRELKQGEGPIVIVAAPTRELAHQIHQECVRFGAVYGLKSTNLVGGLSKGEQWKSLKAGCGEIVVCTPGRLIDMIKMKAIKPVRTTMLVLDEADKMFEMGFEPQVRSIVGQIRPDRQTLLFSATFGGAIEQLAREVLVDPLRITVGSIGAANEDVTQIPILVRSDDEKWYWLASQLPRMLQQPDESVLIFGSTKGSIDLLTSRIAGELRIASVAALHGDKDMNERLKIMHAFKTGAVRVLVATDVAARGLDVKSVRTVINYYLARDLDSHTHRIGRTGRAGVKGTAFSLLIDPNDAQWAGRILNQMRGQNQVPPPELMHLAMRDPRFNKGNQRRTRGGGRGGARGGRRQFSDRSGIGFSAPPSSSSSNQPQSRGGPNYHAVPPPMNFERSTLSSDYSQSAYQNRSAPTPPPSAANLPADIAAGLAKWQAKYQNPM